MGRQFILYLSFFFWGGGVLLFKVNFGFKGFQPGIRSANLKIISHVISKVSQEILFLKKYSLLHHQSAEFVIGYYRKFISKNVAQKNYHVKYDLSSFFS